MSVISTVEAVPSRVKMLYAYLEKSAGEDRARLTAIVGPKGLASRRAQGDDEQVKQNASSTVTEPIVEALQMGLLVEEEGLIKVGAPLDRIRRRSLGFDAAFAEHVESLLLNVELSERAQSSFGFALSWLLMQSPRRPLDFSSNQVTLLREQLGELDDYQITSEPRWQNLCYWSRMLGYCGFVGLAGKTLVVSDPTIALRRHLREVLTNKSQMRIGDVMRELATRCPVLEEGTFRSEVESRSSTLRESVHLSESTSFALRRLQDQNLVTLRALADADGWILDFGEKTERLTHISSTSRL